MIIIYTKIKSFEEYDTIMLFAKMLQAIEDSGNACKEELEVSWAKPTEFEIQPHC